MSASTDAAADCPWKGLSAKYKDETKLNSEFRLTEDDIDSLFQGVLTPPVCETLQFQNGPLPARSAFWPWSAPFEVVARTIWRFNIVSQAQLWISVFRRTLVLAALQEFTRVWYSGKLARGDGDCMLHKSHCFGNTKLSPVEVVMEVCSLFPSALVPETCLIIAQGMCDQREFLRTYTDSRFCITREFPVLNVPWEKSPTITSHGFLFGRDLIIARMPFHTARLHAGFKNPPRAPLLCRGISRRALPPLYAGVLVCLSSQFPVDFSAVFERFRYFSTYHNDEFYELRTTPPLKLLTMFVKVQCRSVVLSESPISKTRFLFEVVNPNPDGAYKVCCTIVDLVLENMRSAGIQTFPNETAETLCQVAAQDVCFHGCSVAPKWERLIGRIYPGVAPVVQAMLDVNRAHAAAAFASPFDKTAFDVAAATRIKTGCNLPKEYLWAGGLRVMSYYYLWPSSVFKQHSWYQGVILPYVLGLPECAFYFNDAPLCMPGSFKVRGDPIMARVPLESLAWWEETCLRGDSEAKLCEAGFVSVVLERAEDLTRLLTLPMSKQQLSQLVRNLLESHEVFSKHGGECSYCGMLGVQHPAVAILVCAVNAQAEMATDNLAALVAECLDYFVGDCKSSMMSQWVRAWKTFYTGPLLSSEPCLCSLTPETQKIVAVASNGRPTPFWPCNHSSSETKWVFSSKLISEIDAQIHKISWYQYQREQDRLTATATENPTPEP